MFDMTTFASSTFEIKWSDELIIHVFPVTLSDSYKIQNIGFNSNNLSLEEKLIEMDYLIFNNNAEGIKLSKEEIKEKFNSKTEMLETINSEYSKWLEKVGAKKN